MIAGSQWIAGLQTIVEVCFHMIADDRRTFCDVRSAINCDHMETSLKVAELSFLIPFVRLTFSLSF